MHSEPILVSPLVIGGSTLVFNVSHFMYHMTKLSLYAPIDQAGNVLAPGAAVAASLWLTWAGRPARA